MIQIGQELINPDDVQKASYTAMHPRVEGNPSVLTVHINGVQHDYHGTDATVPGTNPPVTWRQQVDAAWGQLKPKEKSQ